MNLLSVIITMNPASGGPAQGIRNNIPFWKFHGIEPNILSFDNPTGDFVKADNVTAIGPTANKWAYVPTAKDWLLRHLPAYDVVLVHGLWQYHGYAVTKAIKQLKLSGKSVPKVFVMPHGMLDPYFQKAPERKLKAIRNVAYWHLVEKEVINNADGVLFTCEEEMELAKTTFKGYLPKATYNIGYGITEPPQFSQVQLTAFETRCPAIINKAFFLFLSRIHQKKGVDILLKAYASIYDYSTQYSIELPDLVVAGPGMDTEYGNSLLALLETYPAVKPKIHFPGMLQGDAKWGALYGAELFVLPSHQENFGIAIVEAMACKTPVLITKRVNIWQEIAKGEAGMVADDNMESVLIALRKWVGMTKLEKEAVGISAFNTYRASFTAEATSENFVNVIRHVQQR